MTGCKTESTEDVHPQALRRTATTGRILVAVDRTPEGRLGVSEVQASEPRGKFDEAGRRILAAFRCKESKATLGVRGSKISSLEELRKPRGVQ